AMPAPCPNRLRHAPVFIIPSAIDTEIILPRLALAWPALDFRHVQLEPPERRQRRVQRTHLIGDAEHQTRPVVTRRWTALPAEYKKSSHIRTIILNVCFEFPHVVHFRA